MPLPASFQKLGLLPIDKLRKRRRLMIGTEGLTNSGKTEFIMSAPGPKVILCVDRSYDSMLDNPNPPATRVSDDTVFDVVNIPNMAGGVPFSGQGAFKQDDFVAYFRDLRTRLYNLLDLKELVTLAIDGDSDFWELQVLAEFGRTNQIHPMQYQGVDGARRTIINRCWQAEKIIIGTNKLKDKYEDVLDAAGLPIKEEKTGRNVQRRVAGEYKRQGHRDQGYLWQLQIRHLYKPAEVRTIDKGPLKGKVIGKSKPEWGLRIMKCKTNPVLEGDELWGESCSFRGLVEYVYPNVDPAEWGF